MLSESWCPIPDFQGIYEVSDAGRVRSLDRIDCAGRRLKGRVLRLNASAGGYLSASLQRNGTELKRQVNRLVLEVFESLPPDAGYHAAHKDGTRTNNVLNNLYWATPKENAADKKIHGTEAFGSARAGAKLCEDQVAFIREMLASGATEASLAAVFGVSRGNIHKIKRGLKWALR